MKKISKLEVSCPEGVVFKKIDFNQDALDKEVKLECAAKTNAVVVFDGSVQDERASILDWKFYKKGAYKVEVFAQSNVPFKVLFGFGQYPFTERQTHINTNIGFVGQCLLSIDSFKEALVAFKNSECLTESDASDILRANIVEIIKSAIGTKLSRLRRNEVENELYKLKGSSTSKDPDSLFMKLKSFFATKGLNLDDFTISVNFPGEFEDRYQQEMDNRADAKNAAKEIEILNSVNNKK